MKPLDTERVTRAMLAMKPPRRVWTPDDDAFLREHYRKRGYVWCAKKLHRTPRAAVKRAGQLGLCEAQRWTTRELDILRREWGDVGERALRKKLRGRTWSGIAQKARELGLPAPTQGTVSLKAAAQHIGLHPVTLRRILDASGVQVAQHTRGTTISPRRLGHYRWQRVEIDRAVEAVETWDAHRRARLTVTEAAERCGVSPHTIRRGLLLRVADGLLEGDAPARPGLAWSVTPADADGAMAMLRGAR
jgi:hypothetical protein